MLTINSLAFSQDVKKLPRSTTIAIIQVKPEEIKIENKINLQEFIENLYINSSKYFNEGALPVVEKGEFNVILLDKDSKQVYMKSADFKDYTLNDIESFAFEKSGYSTIYGVQGYYFGIVTIKLKVQ